jgi:hypothetical protein
MPRKPAAETLEAFVRRQEAATLADVLLELATEHEAVRKRLERLALAGQPKALASAFRKTLAGWKRARRFLAYAEARAFGRELETWLEQIERELLPHDPMAALDLVEAFIGIDTAFFERADDSDGVIGSAVHAACRLWLRCAARCEAPADAWPERLAALYDADEYGARESLLRHADDLLDEAALRGLVARYERQLEEVLAAAGADGDGNGRSDRVSAGRYRVSAALSLLSEALRDPDVKVRATLRHSPQPNDVQKEGFVRAYLAADRPADALRWLDEPWSGFREPGRLRWRAQALHALGRTDEAAALRQQVFEATRAVSDLHAWLDLLPAPAQGAAIDRARALAMEEADPEVAARLLLDIGDDAGAQAALLARADRLDGRRYDSLRSLAKALEERACWAGATAVVRVLMLAILERAYTPAYRHAAKDWQRLRDLAELCPDPAPLVSPADFEAAVRQRHGKKVSFWGLVG